MRPGFSVRFAKKRSLHLRCYGGGRTRIKIFLVVMHLARFLGVGLKIMSKYGYHTHQNRIRAIGCGSINQRQRSLKQSCGKVFFDWN